MTQPDYFVALTECHFINPDAMKEISYYPGFSRWYQSVDGVLRAWSGHTLAEMGGGTEDRAGGPPTGADLVKCMDEAGVDVCFALREPMMDVSGYTTSMSTNAYVMNIIEPHPERLYLECNVGPVVRRGLEHAIWELEFLVKEHGARLCKLYAPEDAALNDKRLWPFYEKACELDVPLTVHTGEAYVLPQPSKYTHPGLLDDVLLDFPELKIIAYHMGWPHSEELIGLAGKHQNLYLSLSGIIGWLARAPHRGYHMIGESLQWAGPEKIVMGLDLSFHEMTRVVDFVRNLEMPEELQKNWGYPEITDEIRANILGLTLAKLAKIEPTKRVG
ncbi:MAG: amidohydrolase family protein [Deltaproteobacteria bacterium]|nr:amidohydrolase family protein [Deltaproteobacteria bacterium]